jgi:PAS domain S-box-containing protein
MEGFVKRAWKRREIKMVNCDGAPFYAQLEKSVVHDISGNFRECRIVVSNVDERRRAEEALRKAHDELEQRVRERTAELQKANDELKRKIAEHKQADEALRESEEKYRILIENANDAIFIVQDDRVKFPNPRAQEMTPYSGEELAKISFSDLIHPEDREMVLENHEKRLKGEELPGTYSFRVINRADEVLWVQLNTIFIMWEGRPATLKFMRDITSQKRLEAQFQHAQRMEAVGTLAGGIAHDVNNLLMGIQGHASLMHLDIDPGHPHYERLNNVEQSVKRGAELTSQLLGFARGWGSLYRNKERDD